MLEIMAIRFALIRAFKYIHHSCVMISTDNTTVVSYINKQGGRHSPNLCVEVWKILQWCLKHHIVVRIRHIPGKFNVLADRVIENRQNSQNRDQSIGNSIFQLVNYPNLDLFATRFNHKLPLYVSPVLDNQAFSANLSAESSYSTSLAATNMVLRGSTITCISSSSSSTLSKTINTSKRKVSIAKPPSTQPSRLGFIKQSVRDRTFSQNVADFVSK